MQIIFLLGGPGPLQYLLVHQSFFIAKTVGHDKKGENLTAINSERLLKCLFRGNTKNISKLNKISHLISDHGNNISYKHPNISDVV